MHGSTLQQPVLASGFPPPMAPSQPQDITELLQQLHLTEFIKAFKDNWVDLDALFMMSDEHLKELGLPLGPRLKLVSYLKDQKQQRNGYRAPSLPASSLAVASRTGSGSSISKPLSLSIPSLSSSAFSSGIWGNLNTVDDNEFDYSMPFGVGLLDSPVGVLRPEERLGSGMDDRWRGTFGTGFGPESDLSSAADRRGVDERHILEGGPSSSPPLDRPPQERPSFSGEGVPLDRLPPGLLPRSLNADFAPGGAYQSVFAPPDLTSDLRGRSLGLLPERTSSTNSPWGVLPLSSIVPPTSTVSALSSSSSLSSIPSSINTSSTTTTAPTTASIIAAAVRGDTLSSSSLSRDRDFLKDDLFQFPVRSDLQFNAPSFIPKNEPKQPEPATLPVVAPPSRLPSATQTSLSSSSSSSSASAKPPAVPLVQPVRPLSGSAPLAASSSVLQSSPQTTPPLLNVPHAVFHTLPAAQKATLPVSQQHHHLLLLQQQQQQQQFLHQPSSSPQLQPQLQPQQQPQPQPLSQFPQQTQQQSSQQQLPPTQPQSQPVLSLQQPQQSLSSPPLKTAPTPQPSPSLSALNPPQRTLSQNESSKPPSSIKGPVIATPASSAQEKPKLKPVVEDTKTVWQRGAGRQNSESTQDITCGSCTFINPVSASVCEMCHVLLDKRASSSSSSSSSSGSSGSSSSSSSSTGSSCSCGSMSRSSSTSSNSSNVSSATLRSPPLYAQPQSSPQLIAQNDPKISPSAATTATTASGDSKTFPSQPSSSSSSSKPGAAVTTQQQQQVLLRQQQQLLLQQQQQQILDQQKKSKLGAGVKGGRVCSYCSYSNKNDALNCLSCSKALPPEWTTVGSSKTKSTPVEVPKVPAPSEATVPKKKKKKKDKKEEEEKDEAKHATVPPCPVCTYINSSSAQDCVMCGNALIEWTTVEKKPKKDKLKEDGEVVEVAGAVAVGGVKPGEVKTDAQSAAHAEEVAKLLAKEAKKEKRRKEEEEKKNVEKELQRQRQLTAAAVAKAEREKAQPKEEDVVVTDPNETDLAKKTKTLERKMRVGKKQAVRMVIDHKKLVIAAQEAGDADKVVELEAEFKLMKATLDQVWSTSDHRSGHYKNFKIDL